MSSDDVSSTRRTVLKTVGGTAVGLSVAVGAASADHEHPDVKTYPASDISQDFAVINGEVTAFGDGASSVDAFFQWDFASSSDFSYWTDPVTLDSPSTYSQAISGLQSNTDYKFRAVAEDNDDGDRGYGDTLTFTSLSDDQHIK